MTKTKSEIYKNSDSSNKFRRRKGSPSPEDDKLLDEQNVEELAKNLPQGTNKIPAYLRSIVKSVPDRLKNCVIRTILGALMISVFSLLIYGGPFALMALVLLIQVKCYQEIISIGYQVYKIHGLPWFRSLSWYFLITSNYFYYGESLFDSMGTLFSREEVLRFLITYHRFISFCLYFVGFLWFVLSLVKKYILKQFLLLGWTQFALMVPVIQSYQIIQNMFEGLIWFIVPISMIIINDIMAYIFGFFFGKTPLIELSPKKTWEGFIGGGLATIAFGVVLSYFLCQYQYFVCPAVYSDAVESFVMQCEPEYIFQLQNYTINLFNIKMTMEIYPFVLHSFSMSIFSSVIGPFGGFFASGFKRAFKIKDFGDLIPGHGGIMDRFDCQVMMGTFVNVYISSFIRTASPQKLLAQIYTLNPDQQLEFYMQLKDNLPLLPQEN